MVYFIFTLAYVIGYLTFMVLAYVLAKAIFARIETREELEKSKAQQMEIIKARRVRVKRQRLVQATNIQEPRKIGHRLLPA
jgi:hypothetical protein